MRSPSKYLPLFSKPLVVPTASQILSQNPMYSMRKYSLVLGFLCVLLCNAVAHIAIEPVQRSAQERWVATGASTFGFPIGPSGYPPDFPPDGFYAAYMSNPVKVDELL